MVTVPTNKIGIVSGAGPMAGVALMQKIIERQQLLGCWKDHQFAETVLHQVPFGATDSSGVADKGDTVHQLRCSLETMKSLGCTKVIAACNSMYEFDQPLIHRKLLNDYISYARGAIATGVKELATNRVVVLSSSSSRACNVFDRPHHVPTDVEYVALSDEDQQVVDEIILNTMLGIRQQPEITNAIDVFFCQYRAIPVLACTELCIHHITTPLPHFNSLDIMAKYALDVSAV